MEAFTKRKEFIYFLFKGNILSVNILTFWYLFIDHGKIKIFKKSICSLMYICQYFL